MWGGRNCPNLLHAIRENSVRFQARLHSRRDSGGIRAAISCGPNSVQQPEVGNSANEKRSYFLLGNCSGGQSRMDS